MSDNIYCTYLTVYFGYKLPPFYIGSSSIDIINNGYRGSVSSKEYKQIWKTELKNNSHLFKIHIISYHKTREEANIKERSLHIALNVVNNPMYINRSITWDKKFGVVGKGKNHFNYGRKHSLESKKKLSIKRTGSGNNFYGKKHSHESKQKIGSYHKGKIISKEHIESMGSKISKFRTGLQWFNDGVKMYQLKPEDEKIIQLNLIPGMLHRKINQS